MEGRARLLPLSQCKRSKSLHVNVGRKLRRLAGLQRPPGSKIGHRIVCGRRVSELTGPQSAFTRPATGGGCSLRGCRGHTLFLARGGSNLADHLSNYSYLAKRAGQLAHHRRDELPDTPLRESHAESNPDGSIAQIGGHAHRPARERLRTHTRATKCRSKSPRTRSCLGASLCKR